MSKLPSKEEVIAWDGATNRMSTTEAAANMDAGRPYNYRPPDALRDGEPMRNSKGERVYSVHEYNGMLWDQDGVHIPTRTDGD